MTVYRLLLQLFPRGFRDRFGADMAEVFADRRRAARRRGQAAVAGLWIRTIVDVTTQALAERRDMRNQWSSSARGPRLSAFLDDLVAAQRSLRRRPGFTIAAAGMLAVGLGFNTALFAIVNAVVLKPLPYFKPDRILMVWTGRNPDGTGAVNSYADYVDWKARATSFEALATYNISYGPLTGAGDPEEVGGAVVSPEFFRVLGARVLLGRALEDGDERVKPEEGRPIVIAYSLWKRRFHLDPGMIDHTLTLAGRPRRVVGVLSPEFKQPEPFWGESTEYWSPLTVTDTMRTQRSFHYLRVIGRLKDGASLAQARGELDAVGRRLMQDYPASNTQSVVAVPVAEELAGDTRPLLWLFLGAVSLVLLLAVANIVNLLLARASGRRTEMALRAALGASRGRLISQLVAESTLLGVLGGALGLAFAEIGIRLVVSYSPGSAPGIHETAIDATVLAFALIVSALTGALCGAVPAFRVARARFSSSLGDMRGSSGLEASRSRRWLVAAEMALAVPLLVGAALLTETLVSMQRVDPGFDPNHTLQFRVSASGPRYDSPGTTVAFFDELRAKLAALPGATSVGMVSSLPLGGLNNTGGSILYTKPDGQAGELGVGFRAIAGSYFATMNVPLVQGRLFDDSVADTDTVIVNDLAARQMWGSAKPIGQRVRFGSLGDPAHASPWLTVVGVVGSVRHEALTRSANPEIFQPHRVNQWATMTVTIRTASDPGALAAPARAVVRDLDPNLPLVGLGIVRQFIDGQLAGPRFGVLCSTVFGMLGVALSAFGTFAVLSLLVAQRTREIGIRMALGATPTRVASLIARQSLLPALAGCGVGAIAAGWLTRGLASQLFGVAPGDPAAFALAVGTLTGVACAASWWPTRRAMKIDPVRALRAD